MHHGSHGFALVFLCRILGQSHGAVSAGGVTHSLYVKNRRFVVKLLASFFNSGEKDKPFVRKFFTALLNAPAFAAVGIRPCLPMGAFA